MSVSRVLGTLSVVFTFTFAGSAAARPPGCSEQCTSSTPPSTLCTCWERAGAPVTTCGQYEQDMCGLLLAPPVESLTSEEGLKNAQEIQASSNPSEEEASEANVCRTTT